MKVEELRQMIQVCTMYYEAEIKQEEISRITGLSRPKVSRLITKAKELGYIKISVFNPLEQMCEKELKLKEKFGFKECKICPYDEFSLKENAAKSAGELLIGILKPKDIIGISWGTTLEHLVDNLPPVDIKDLEVVQLKGLVAQSGNNSLTYGVAEDFAKCLQAKLCYLPLPVMLESKELKEQFMKEPTIKKAVQEGEKANVAIFSIGYPSADSVVAKYGYIEQEMMEKMRKEGVSGDICSRYFKMDGSIFDKELDSRNTSIELAQLRKKEYSIGVTVGEYSMRSIIGAVNGGYINCLVTDEKTADKLLDYKK